MLTTEQAKKNVDSAKSKLESIQADLARKETEYNSAQEAHAKNVAATAGRQRYPKSLSVQRDSLLRLKMEIEGLERAMEIAERTVAEAENRLQLVELYENVVKPYQQAELVHFQKAEDLISAIQELNEMTEKLCTSVDSFLEQTDNPVAILKGLLDQPVMAGLSLGRFLGGEIVEATAGENDRFLGDLASKYAEIARRLPEVKAAQDSLESLSDYLSSVSGDANTLVPRHVKYVQAQIKPSKPKSQVQKGHVLPRHARGGPDQDQKDNFNSDYWFHRRRALLQAKDATTAIGKAKT